MTLVQRPEQPSLRWKLPEPLRPLTRPVLTMRTPLSLPIVFTTPLELMLPEKPWPMTLPLLITAADVTLPGGQAGPPTLVTIHAPSKLPPPAADERAREGSLRRGEGRSRSTARGSEREPDSALSSLPMLPPALPD
ncbi:hypothetical protein BRADO3319 [Bradyrhizobium sp. ORS 278]|nr:hypothetical protein BRADO3319 [Bradyrhizobium sp. ORS 278]